MNVDLSGKKLQAGKKDVVFVYASVIDSAGTLIPEDIRAVTFTVEGDAELIGDNSGKAEAGISTILLMAAKTTGVLKVKASADGLNSGAIEIKVQ